MTREPPPKLYKYQSYTVQTLDNLKSRCLWFSKPANFNDPFDCAIRFEISEISKDDWQALFDMYREKAPVKVAFDAKYSQKGHPNDKFKSEIVVASDKVYAERVEFMRHHRGVTCFSEKVDDILMWAHYADGHQGFCLEFDTTYDPFPKAFPVTYLDASPTITLNPADIMVRSSYDQLMNMWTIKSSDWSYEKEWRIFHMEGDKKYIVDVSALTGVYFGYKMPFRHQEIISLVLAGSPTQLYQMKLSGKGSNKLISKAVKYHPPDYSKKPTST